MIVNIQIYDITKFCVRMQRLLSINKNNGNNNNNYNNREINIS